MPPARPAPHPALRRRASRGLTVVELMLVLALVGVLVSLAVAGWNGWRDRIRTKAAQDDLISIAAVIDQHYEDTGGFPADLAAIGRAGMRDPWGNAYVYLDLTPKGNKGKARKDHSLVPLNTDFDLYSKGPDGSSSAPLTAKSSKDDILRANNGRFIGRASDY